MLQSVRDNLKGTVAVFVLAIFIIPLILFGVEQLFVGSVGGTDVATVNGESLSRTDFMRELTIEKQRLQQQFELPPNSPQLEDSALSGPVLQRMVQREALYQAAVDGRMGASKADVWKQIASIEAFQVDGKFNNDLFRERISYLYTPATFLRASEKDFVLGHMNSGVADTAFVTPHDLQLLAAITQQKRTFSTIDIPRTEKPKSAVTDAELQQYYDANAASFVEPEKLKVSYVELDADELAESVDVSESDVRSIYQEEIATFKAAPRFTVAHILIEDNAVATENVKAVEAKLAGGADFGEVAQQHSADLGSKDSGGNLGLMIDEAYPKEFVAAAKKLEVGAVSAPVKTDAGFHFIKLIEKSNVEPPSFEERKDSIARQLARDVAQEDYIKKVSVLDEKTFGADSLRYAADELGLEIKTTDWFSRNDAVGVMANQQLLNEAFGDEVLAQKHNSKVIETGDGKAYVLRLAEHQPSRPIPFADVKEQINQQLTEQRIVEETARRAQEVLAEIAGGKSAEEVAKEHGLEYKVHEGATRNSFEIGGAVLQKAFSLPRPASQAPVLDSVSTPAGGAVVIRLTAVEDGSIADLPDMQRNGLKNQLRFQVAQNELNSFETGVIEKAKIKLSK